MEDGTDVDAIESTYGDVPGGKVMEWFRSKSHLGGKLWASIKQGAGDDPADLSEMEERLALASVLGQVILSSNSLEEVCEGFVDELRRLMPVDWGALALIDYSGGKAALHPLSDKIACGLDIGHEFLLTRTPLERLVHNQTALLEPDLRVQSEFNFGKSLLKEKVRSVVYMPLFSRRQVFGSLITGSHRPDSYGDRELKLLKYAAVQLGTVAENRLLDRENNKQTRKQTDFIAALAHELKTPLTPIRASSELLAEELNHGDGNVRGELAANIRQSAQIMEQKLSGLLELARVESPDFKLELHHANPKPLLEQVLRHVRSEVREKRQVLKTDFGELPPVMANEAQTMRVLHTLLSNAVWMSPVGGGILLIAGRQGNEVVVEVKDSGQGFSREALAHLFQVYDANASDRQRFPEMRLSLALSKRLIELQNGRMWVESQPGAGSTFAFSLPVDGLKPEAIW